MKRLLLPFALLLSLWGVVPLKAQPAIVGPPNAVQCNQLASLAVGSTGLTQIVAAVAGQRVFICGWHVTNTGATGTFLFANGTGSNCGTNTVTQIPALNVTSTAPSADHQTFASFQTPIGAAFCVNPSVNTIAVVIYYAQF